MIKTIVAGMALVLALTGCGTQEVTPPSCLRALDSASTLLTYVENGNIEGYNRWFKANEDRITEAVADCRAKAER